MNQKIVYMDGVDWQHHVDGDKLGATMYSSVERVLAASPCARECGVVRLRVIEEDWPVKQDLYSNLVSLESLTLAATEVIPPSCAAQGDSNATGSNTGVTTPSSG